jgi:hypothetical protein
MNDVRPWTYAALFGALWGSLELSVGTILQLSRMPLRGTIMAFFGLLCMFTLRKLQPEPGICLLTGFVVIVLKVFSMGGFIPGPVIGIGLEAIIVELTFAVTKNTRLSAALSGAGVLVSHPIQMVLMIRLMSGPEPLAVMVRSLSSLLEKMSINPPSVQILAVLFLGFWFMAGLFLGLGAWRIAGRVAGRVGIR